MSMAKGQVNCRHCGTEIAGNALICYRCGRATTAPRVAPPSGGSVFAQPRRSRLGRMAVIMVVVVLVLVVWLVLGGP